MKHYYDQRLELQIAQYRLEGLKERKKLLFGMAQPKATAISSTCVQNNTTNNVFDTYICNIEEIDKEISLVERDINILQNYLNIMERGLRQIKGSLERVFVLRYIDGLTVSEIQQITHYSQASIYRKLTIISKILKVDKK